MAERETTKQCKKSARESNESEEIRLIIKLATCRGGQIKSKGKWYSKVRQEVNSEKQRHNSPPNSP